MEVVTTPTFHHLAEHAASCTSRVLIGSPFVNDGIVSLTSLVPKNVPRTMVTRTDLRAFATGASNLGTLCQLSREGFVIHSLSGLHAKIYVFDESYALVTSANATNGGMHRNLECGLATRDRGVVNQLATSLLGGLGAKEPPSPMKLGDLESLRVPVQNLKAAIPPPPAVSPATQVLPVNPVFSISDKGAFVGKFRGWTKLTLENVLALDSDEFDLQQLYAKCRDEASREYPKNRNVEAKLRQQLQVLNRYGIVEFFAPDQPGHYRRTMS